MKSVALAFALSVLSATTTAEKGVNRFVITFGDEDFDDLEMIPQSKDHDIVNNKLKSFHDFVRGSKMSKHARRRFFFKNTAYRRTELEYEKIMRNTIEKMKDFNEYRKVGRRREGAATNSSARRDARQGVLKKGDDDDDDDDDDDEDYYYDEYGRGKERIPNFSNEVNKLKYEAQVNESEAENKVFKYSDEGKPEESPKEAFNKIIDVKTPKNCSEYSGFGIQYVKCLIELFKRKELSGWKAFSKFMKVVAIWIIIYLVIAIPLWCIKGWGCCCFRCDMCRPRKVVKDIQKYLSENPPGVFVNENGEEEHYAPTNKERELYDKINKSILHM